MPPTPAARPLVRPFLLGMLALVLGVALWRSDAPPAPSAPPAAPSDSASARSPVDTAPQVHGDSAERAWVEATLARWNGEQRWIVGFATDSTAEFHEAVLDDSSAADVLEALVRVPALRDSGGTIELLGGAAPVRARLDGPVDSVLRATAENQIGCIFPATMRLWTATGPARWERGFVPGMATVIPPDDTNAAAHRGEAARLLAALRDTTADGASADSLPAGPWDEPSLRRWEADGLEILVASRRRTIRQPQGDLVGEERQLVIADRQAGGTSPFASRFAWRARSWPDEERGVWVEGAMRVGPRRRFVILLGHRGKEGGAGSMLVRAKDGWREAVSWSWGC